MKTEDRLPIQVDPLRYARSRRALKGCLPIVGMSRLKDILANEDAVLSAELLFGFDDQKRVVVDLQLEGTLELVCQRCLGPLQENVVIHSRIGVVTEESEIFELPDKELFLLKEGFLDVAELLEEELLLSLPSVPMHEGQCPNGQRAPEKSGLLTQDTRRPFEILSQLNFKKGE